MNNMLIKLFLLLSAVLLLSCSGSKPSRYYLLSEMTEPEPVKDKQNELRIGIGPVRFPEYLKRPQIGYYVGDNQLSYAEYDRWAEPIDLNFMRVLSDNLSGLLGTNTIYTYPFIAASELDYQLVLDVHEFEMSTKGDVRLSVQWQIVDASDQQSLVTQRSTFIEKAIPENYPSIVLAMSRALGKLSIEIVGDIKKLE
jgi:uncharacterized lipoprotein YmbA